MTNQNLILPSGTSKIGEFEYDVTLNASPTTIQELNDLPVKAVGNTTIYVHDVAHVRDGFAPQTNIVRRDGNRGVLLTIMKIGSTSTLEIVKQVRDMLPQIAATLPPELKIEPISDQSLFVRAAVSGVVREAIIAACLTAIMILLFLGSWRSTLIIAISIPLSILTSICVLSALGETINIMTLGGLALAVGILVDDATVTIENIDRNFDEGKGLHDGILRWRGADRAAGARVHAVHLHRVPADVLPDRRGAISVRSAGRSGGVRDAGLVRALANAGSDPGDVSAASVGAHHSRPPAAWNIAARFQRAFERSFNVLRDGYHRTLEACIRRRIVFSLAFLGSCAAAFLLLPWLGQDFFPSVDAGRFNLHFRAQDGHTDRRNRPARRFDRSFHPPGHSASGTRKHHR